MAVEDIPYIANGGWPSAFTHAYMDPLCDRVNRFHKVTVSPNDDTSYFSETDNDVTLILGTDVLGDGSSSLPWAAWNIQDGTEAYNVGFGVPTSIPVPSPSPIYSFEIEVINTDQGNGFSLIAGSPPPSTDGISLFNSDYVLSIGAESIEINSLLESGFNVQISLSSIEINAGTESGALSSNSIAFNDSSSGTGATLAGTSSPYLSMSGGSSDNCFLQSTSLQLNGATGQVLIDTAGLGGTTASFTNLMINGNQYWVLAAFIP